MTYRTPLSTGPLPKKVSLDSESHGRACLNKAAKFKHIDPACKSEEDAENKLAKARKTRTSPSTLNLKKFGLGKLWVKKVFRVKNVFWVKKVF